MPCFGFFGESIHSLTVKCDVSCRDIKNAPLFRLKKLFFISSLLNVLMKNGYWVLSKVFGLMLSHHMVFHLFRPCIVIFIDFSKLTLTPHNYDI